MLIPVESQLRSNYDDHNNLQLERNLQVLHARIHPTIRHLLCQIDITYRVLTPQMTSVIYDTIKLLTSNISKRYSTTQQ